MKAIVINRYGDPAGLEERPRPVPGAKDLLVEVAAASINPLDNKIRTGQVKAILKLKFPLILGNDLSGTVVEVGREVTRFRPGDEVYARLERDRLGAFGS